MSVLPDSYRRELEAPHSQEPLSSPVGTLACNEQIRPCRSGSRGGRKFAVLVGLVVYLRRSDACVFHSYTCLPTDWRVCSDYRRCPVPCPVVGMVLLFVFLMLKGVIPEPLRRVSGVLLNNLSLLFVPAGVGVMVHFKLLGTDVFPLAVALVVSTLITVVVTALVMVFLNKRTSRSRADDGEV